MTQSAPIATVASTSSAASAGGSVIDVNSLVTQLVTATRTPQDNLIAAKTETVTTQISAVGTLKSALASFQSALAVLDTPSQFNVETATSSNQDVFTATTDSNAVGGTYSVDVTQLASAQQLVSKPFVGGSSSIVGQGTLHVSLGSTSFDVPVDGTNDTVAGIAAAINSANGNPGVTATVISGTDGAHLVLSSSLTGAANTLQVSETDGGTALSALTYGTGNTANYTQKEPAADAEFSLSGIAHTSSTNTVSDALAGVTLTLTGTSAADDSAGTGETLTIASDTGTIQANIANFVTAYNTLVGSFTKLGSYDSTTGTAGPLLGDPLLSGIQNQIRSALYSVVNTGSTTYNSLASVGITTNKDGTLSLNNATLSTAMATAPGAVSSLFSSANGGVAANLNTQMTNALSKNASIDARSTTLVKQDTALSDQTTALNAQMAQLTATLTQQYATLNTLLSSLQSTSAYLTQQFAALPKIQSGN
jgi:flagellar hook-associated protein 2